MARSYGIDVSQHNGYVDVSKYDFVIIRALSGTTEDPKLSYWVKLCESKKVPYGVYVYSYALDSAGARSEAEMTLEVIKKYNLNIQIGVWFDMEDADGYKKKRGALTETKITEFCNTYCKIVKDAGYYVGIYSTLSWFQSYMPNVMQTDKWIANWGINDGKVHGDFSKYGTLHQYTSNMGRLDENVCYVPLTAYSINKEVKPIMAKKMTSKRNGIQDFLCPFKKVYITQGTGVGTHEGTQAIDVVNGDGTRAAYYAPADVKVVATWPASGQAMWQTINKVRCPNGYVGIVTFVTVHDDTFNVYPGYIAKQGEQIGNMGNAGRSVGIHCHIQCAQGSDTSWYANAYKIYQMNNEKDPTEVWYCDGVEFLNYKNAGWQYLPKPSTSGKIGITPHCQTTGWKPEVFDGTFAGEKGKRLEAFKIRSTDGTVIENIKAHIQNEGWKNYDHPGKGTIIGTVGHAKRLECLIIKTDKACVFRVYLKGIGYTPWTKCDGICSLGTVGQSLPIEGIEIKRA